MWVNVVFPVQARARCYQVPRGEHQRCSGCYSLQRVSALFLGSCHGNASSWRLVMVECPTQEKANEQPLWKKPGGPETWIYHNQPLDYGLVRRRSSCLSRDQGATLKLLRHGNWCIGGKEARLHQFDWNRCFLYQSMPQAGWRVGDRRPNS